MSISERKANGLIYPGTSDDTKQVIYDRDVRRWVEVYPEDEGYERSITVYRTPQGWVTIPE